MITLDTFAALLEYQHGLDAYCSRCERWGTVDLAGLVARGQGSRSFIGQRPVCGDCGQPGQYQVRPPVPQASTAGPANFG